MNHSLAGASGRRRAERLAARSWRTPGALGILRERAGQAFDALITAWIAFLSIFISPLLAVKQLPFIALRYDPRIHS